MKSSSQACWLLEPGIGARGRVVSFVLICASGARYLSEAVSKFDPGSSCHPDGSGPGQVFVLSKVNGRWSTPKDVTATLHNGGPAQIVEMACPAAGKCRAAGYYWPHFQEVAFVISQVR